MKCRRSRHTRYNPLPLFLAYALHRTKLHPSVTFAALVLLQRLKARFPTAQGMFTLREINQMEREMCNYLDWELTVDANFETMVKRDFTGSGAYPTYGLQMVSKRAVREAAATASTATTPIPQCASPIPAFGQRHTSKSVQPPPPSSAPIYSSPTTPDTPSTTPASSSPPTPIGVDDYTAKIVVNSPALAMRYDSNKDKVIAVHPLKEKMFAFAMPSAW